MSDDPPFIRASLSDWRVAEIEARMREDARSWPEYRVAHIARKFALDVGMQLSRLLPETGTLLEGSDPATVNRAAGIRLSVIGTRGAGAAIATLSSGYEPETGSNLRRIVECVLRARKIGDDPSGEYARRWIKIGKAGDLTKLAQRYGEAREVELLNRMAHSDAHSIGFFAVGAADDSGAGPMDLNALPVRHDGFSRHLFLQIAYETVGLSMAVAELFGHGLIIPPFLANGLKARMREPHPPAS